MQIRTNLPEFKSKLQQIGRDMEKRSVRQATRAAAKVVEKLAKQYAPVRDPATRKVVGGQRILPGVLKASIGMVTKRGPKGTITVMVIPRSGRRTRRGKGSAATRDAYYWAWVEQGHVIAPGRKRLAGGERRRRLERARLSAAGRRTRPAWFLKRAWQAGKGPALDAFYAQLEKSFQKYSTL